MATIDPIDSLSRVLALADGRDPAEATANDRDRSIEFLNLFHAASGVVKFNNRRGKSGRN